MSLRVRLPNPLIALDDRALLTRFADERDQLAFEQLVKRHGGLVYGVCKRTVRDRHLAEDAFQAVFLILARNPRRAAEAASVVGWLFGVARRVGLAARRQEFLDLIAPFRSKSGRWDCIVPWSGGKDSSSIAWRLKFEFGLNPLLVTFAPLVVKRQAWLP